MSPSPFQRFIHELRRRHVPQTAAVYAVAAWAAIQFADVVAPNLGWPQWVVTAVIIASAVGFPVVLGMAWVFDWGPEGLHRTGPEPPATTGPTPTGPRSTTPVMAAMAVLLVAIGSAVAVALVLDAQPDESTGTPTSGTAAEAADGRRAPLPPRPPGLISPDVGETVRQSLSELEGVRGIVGLDSILENLDRLGLGGADSVTEATGIELWAPEAWLFGAPASIGAGDSVRIRGVARAREGVARVEIGDRVVARSDEPTSELDFSSWFRPTASAPGRLRRLEIRVITAAGETRTRSVPYIVVPPTSGTGHPPGGGAP